MERADITVNENSLIESIKEIIITSRKNIVRSVNTEMLSAYWNIGKLIIEDEQKNQERAQYGDETLKNISKRLKAELGNGFSISNLQFMRRLFLAYPNQQTLSVKLSWSHYCELLAISDDGKRSFYEKECITSRWSVRELKRQLDSPEYAQKERDERPAPIFNTESELRCKYELAKAHYSSKSREYIEGKIAVLQKSSDSKEKHHAKECLKYFLTINSGV